MKTLFLRPLAAAAALALSASSCFAIDLIGSYERALTADPTQRAANEALTAGREKAVQGDALLWPRISLSGSLSHNDNHSSTPSEPLPPPLDALSQGDSAGTSREVALQLSQPIYDAKAWADRRQLRAQTEIAETRFRDAQQALMQRVGEAYFGMLLAQESLRVVQAEKAAVQLQRDRAQVRFDVGRGKITDLQEAQARVDGVATRELSAQSTLALRQAQYLELTGEPADRLAPLRARFDPQPPQPDNLGDWQRIGEARSTRVQLRQQELAMAQAEAGKHTLAARPTLELIGRIGQRQQDGSLSSALSPESHRTAMVGLQLTVPLFAGGALDSRQRESAARQREADEQLVAARRDTRLQVQDGYLAVKTGIARIAALEQSLTSTRTALDATTLARDLGTRTELDVLDAQQRMFQVELDLAQARHDYLLGRIRLATAAGDMQADELRALNAYLAL